MIGAMAKIAAIGTIAYCAAGSFDNLTDQVNQIASLPRRMMTVHELKQIHRLIRYDLVGESARPVQLAKFCREELSASGRDPGHDYWDTPYRLYFRGTLHNEESSVVLANEDADGVFVVSAGADKKFYTRDDLTSKGNADKEVQLLLKEIESHVKKEESQAKKNKSPFPG